VIEELINFIYARLTEDEAEAIFWSDMERSNFARMLETGAVTSFAIFHAGSPERILVEVAEKRRALTEFAANADGGNGEGYMAERALKYLAAPYFDHPKYREEWRP
jgi:hypothetical protein